MCEPANRPPGLTELWLTHLVGRATGSEFADWAVGALETGFDSPNLRILAGLGSSAVGSEAEFYFHRALREQQIEIPSEKEIIQDYVREISRKILADEISPERGADLIHSRVLSPFNHPADLLDWCYLSEGLHPQNFGQLVGDELDEAIRKQALDTLRTSACSHD